VIYRSINPEVKKKAIAYLKSKLTEQTKHQLRGAIADDPEEWFAPYHFQWGMAMRNLLRSAGFGEEQLKVSNLDDVYVELIEDAIKLDGKEKDGYKTM
jgi:hypothetical protein